MLGNGAGGFTAPTTFATAGHPLSVAVGDLNKDSKTDIVTANSASGNVSIFLGDGTGGFSPAINLSTGTSTPVFVIVGDFNHDTNIDLAVAHSNGTIAVMPGSGSATFGPPINFAGVDRPVSMTSGDFNLDGHLDLAVVTQFDGKVSILPGDGAGGFGAASAFTAGTETTDVAGGDFNNDGKLDLAVSLYASNMAVLLNNGDGSFGAPTLYAVVGQSPTSTVVVGDFNNDGNNDLAAGNVSVVSIRFGNGSGSFGGPTNYTAGLGPSYLAVSDFNSDGTSDLVAAAYSDSSIALFLNDGTGAFLGAPRYTVGSNPNSVLKADFNNDGRLDLAVANRDSNNVSILLGDGTGAFGATRNFTVGPPPQFASGNQPFSMAAGDFNGDGKTDLVTADFTGSAVSVLLGDGAGNFPSAQKISVGGSPWYVAVGDFNGDLKLDLVVTRNGSDSISVLLGDGAGGFAAPVTFGGLQGPRPIAVADLNGDGKADIVVGNQSGLNNASVFLGNGAGGFSAPSSYTIESFANPSSIAVADFNGDARPDLMIAEQGKSKVALLLGDGSGGFSAPLAFTVGAAPAGVAVGDFNGDGFRDVAVANSGSSSVSVLAGNGSGGFSASPSEFLTRFPNSVVAGDFNGDGRVDLATDGVDVLINTCADNPVASLPIITVNDVSVSEEGGTATFSIGLSAASTLPTTVQYYTSGQSAVSGSDFQAGSGTLTFLAGETVKNIVVPVLDDSINEFTERFSLNLHHPVNATIKKRQGIAAIIDSDPEPGVSIDNVRVNEGNSGTTPASFTVALSSQSGKLVTLKYSTSDGTATAGQDYVAASGAITFGPGETTKKLTIAVNGDAQTEPDETFFVNLANPVNVVIVNGRGTGTIINDAPIQLSAPSYSVSESGPSLDIIVKRANGATAPATVNYATTDTAGANNCNVSNGAASPRCDYLTTIGTLNFAANETSKTISIPIVDDSYAEMNEIFTITLSNPIGATLGSPATATITITDNEASNGTNPIDQTSFFVRLHYIDFLNREPDTPGLNFWINNIDGCSPKPSCTEIQRINTSGAFFLSIEFQDTGYFVYRAYKAAFGDANGTSTTGGNHNLSVPVIRLNEFLLDTQRIGQGVIVGQGNWQQQIDANKDAFAEEFVQRTRFLTDYPLSMTPAQFVDKLNSQAATPAVTGVKPLSTTERDALVTALTNGSKTRGRVLREVAEDQTLASAEFNRAFVLMQFFGYLRRNPNDPQDTDYAGYEFWLGKLNQFNGNFANADMVKSFIVSGEYRTRFGP